MSFRLLRVSISALSEPTVKEIHLHVHCDGAVAARWGKVSGHDITAGYLDQHAKLEKGQSVRDVLRLPLMKLFKTESRINDIYMSMADGVDMDALMEEGWRTPRPPGKPWFYTPRCQDWRGSKGSGVMDYGMDTDVTELSGGQRTKILLAKLLWKNQISCFWMSRLTTWMRTYRLAQALPAKIMKMPLSWFPWYSIPKWRD